jgi:hypothetical protein
MGDNKQEYILTKDDVNSDYSDNNIKQSFTVKTMKYEGRYLNLL